MTQQLRTPRAGLRPARPPRGTRKLGAALRFLERTLGGLLLMLAATLALPGCGGGSGAGLDGNGRPLGEGNDPDGPLTASFGSIQSHVFTPVCAVCHAGGSAPQGLRLDAANSYAMLVGVASAEVSSLQRVKPGDPDNSYLVQKIEGHAAVGVRMPYGGPYLDAETIATIRQWISDGALP